MSDVPHDLAELARTGNRWAFDVDGTLIGSIRSDVTRPGAALLLERLSMRGVVCVLWSAGGADYARRMAIQHGLDGSVTEYYAKQARDLDGFYRLDHLLPSHLPDVLVDDSPGDLRCDGRPLVVPVRQFIGGHSADRELFALIERVG